MEVFFDNEIKVYLKFFGEMAVLNMNDKMSPNHILSICFLVLKIQN